MRLLASVIVCLMCSASIAAAPETDNWRLVTTPQFRVLSQLDADSTAFWIKTYQQFVAATSAALGINTRSLPPLTVILFRNDRAYTPYKLATPSGRTANVAGQFMRWQGWSALAVAGGRVDNQSVETIYHEATHWLMSADRGRQPAWFSEGIAEMLSTFEWKGSKVTWAKPIGSHLAVLNQVAPQPLAQFLLEPSAIFDRENRTAIFYAQSWAFVHFMMLSRDTSRRDLMLKFLASYRRQSGEATVREVIGERLVDLQKDFLAYTRERRFAYIELPVQTVPDPPASVRAPPEDVEAGLGFLALGAGRVELARQHAERALSLAPEKPGGHELMAYLHHAAEESEGTVTHAQAALRGGSRDAQMYVLIGDNQLQGSDADPDGTGRRRIALYEQAINLDPQRRDLHQRLAEAMLNQEKPTAEDRRFLQLGLRLFPGEDFLRVAMAFVDRRLGERARAFSLLDEALRSDTTLDEQQRGFVEGLRRTWWVEQMNDELRAAQNASEPGRARQILAGYRGRLEADVDLAKYLAESDRAFALAELLQKAEQAHQKGRSAEASALADQILAHPDVTPDQRRYAESLKKRPR
jgi:hypothetical protein